MLNYNMKKLLNAIIRFSRMRGLTSVKIFKCGQCSVMPFENSKCKVVKMPKSAGSFVESGIGKILSKQEKPALLFKGGLRGNLRKISPNPLPVMNFSPLTHFSNTHEFALKNSPLPQGARGNGLVPSFVARVQASCAKRTVKNLFPYSPIYLFTSKKAAFTLAEGATHVALSDSQRKVAFTLAEVLITLGIIGVVAALTLPSVINNIQDKQFKTAFKKQYSVFSQTLQMIYAKDGEALHLERFGSDGDWQVMDTQFCRLIQELKAVKSGFDCSNMTVNATISWHKNSKWFNKKNEPQRLNSSYHGRTIVLADGTLVNFNCWKNIYVDVNGSKPPNTIGRDIFYFTLSQDSTALKYSFPVDTNGCSGAINVILTKDNYEDDCKNGSGWGCSPLYILN